LRDWTAILRSNDGDVESIRTGTNGMLVGPCLGDRRLGEAV